MSTGPRHFVEYYDAMGWETPVMDPLDLTQQTRLKRDTLRVELSGLVIWGQVGSAN